MTAGNEERMSRLLTFPFNSYLMLRLEYVLLTSGDELEAKILRLIEVHMDGERKHIYRGLINAAPPGTFKPGQVIEITRDVWVPISHNLFLYDLYETVKSETTLKRALKSLVTKKLIKTRHQPKKRYDAPEYQLNIPLIEREFAKMEQSGKGGYQFLTPSEFDPLNNTQGGQNLTPSWGQKLTPSEGQNLTPSASVSSSVRGAEFDPNSRRRISSNELVEESVDGPGNSPHPYETEQATAVAHSSLGNLSDEEVAFILELRLQRAAETSPPPLEEMPPVVAAPSEQTEIITQANEQHEEEAPKIAPALQRPVSDASLTDEVIVSLYEYKHGCRYEEESRPFQLQAARALLGLRLALSVDLLEQVYDECCDKWWREHYGELHVSHLVEKEKNHAQRRIVRLLKRVQSRRQVAATTNGEGSATASTTTGEPERMVMWKGRLVPEEQAYKEGYEGGFERFKKGEHPDDDLEASLKRLQAEGKLPVFEGVSTNG